MVCRDPLRDVAGGSIVDGRLDRILLWLREPERDIDEKRLPRFALLLAHAVTAEDLEPAHLDDHPATVAATFSASTCSRTSWARMIVAPRS